MAELRQLFNELIRLEIELWDAVDRRLRDACDISMGTFDVIEIVARIPSCRVYDIARDLSITVGGTSKAVDRIEGLGYLARRSNPEDRRSSIIELTPAGAAKLAEAGAVVDAELEVRLGAALPASSLDQLSGFIARLRTAGAQVDAADQTTRSE
jgi:DNA-binding MarR family transcriptional regulator